MTSAADIAEQAIAKLEAEENGDIQPDASKEEPKQDDNAKKTDEKQDKPADDKGDKASKPDSKEPVDKDKDESKDKDAKADKEEEEEGKFTADDALEVDEPEQQPQAPTDNAGIQLSQPEQEYIAKNIGEPLVIRGIQGEGDNAKEVEIKAYTVNDIPANFRFSNDQQRLAAQTGFVRLENKAEQLLGSYRQQQSQTAAQDFERRENEGIRTDIAELQQEGLFPKFKVQPGAKGFDDTAEAKMVTDVLKIQQERNDLYLSQYNQGRPYKHIGFREAYELYEKSNPDKQAEKARDADQKKEDAERTKVADKVSTNRGLTQSKIVKPTIRSGVTIDQILAAHEMD